MQRIIGIAFSKYLHFFFFIKKPVTAGQLMVLCTKYFLHTSSPQGLVARLPSQALHIPCRRMKHRDTTERKECNKFS